MRVQGKFVFFFARRQIDEGTRMALHNWIEDHHRKIYDLVAQ